MDNVRYSQTFQTPLKAQWMLRISLSKYNHPDARESMKITVMYIGPNRVLYIQERECTAHTNVAINDSLSVGESRSEKYDINIFQNQRLRDPERSEIGLSLNAGCGLAASSGTPLIHTELCYSPSGRADDCDIIICPEILNAAQLDAESHCKGYQSLGS